MSARGYKRTSNRNWTKPSRNAAEDREQRRRKDAEKEIIEDINAGWLHFYRERGLSKPPRVSAISLGCFEIIK